MTLGDKLREATQRAAVLSVGDDWLISIRLRSYGYLVEGQREVDEQIRCQSRQLLWPVVEDARGNPLLLAVDYVHAELIK